MPKSELRDSRGRLIGRGLSHRGGMVKPLEVTQPVVEVKEAPKVKKSGSK
jgi:hypothetical protein